MLDSEAAARYGAGKSFVTLFLNNTTYWSSATISAFAQRQAGLRYSCNFLRALSRSDRRRVLHPHPGSQRCALRRNCAFTALRWPTTLKYSKSRSSREHPRAVVTDITVETFMHHRLIRRTAWPLAAMSGSYERYLYGAAHPTSDASNENPDPRLPRTNGNPYPLWCRQVSHDQRAAFRCNNDCETATTCDQWSRPTHHSPARWKVADGRHHRRQVSRQHRDPSILPELSASPGMAHSQEYHRRRTAHAANAVSFLRRPARTMAGYGSRSWIRSRTKLTSTARPRASTNSRRRWSTLTRARSLAKF